MFKNNKKIELKQHNSIKQQLEPKIVINIKPTTEEKIEILEDFYMWVFDNLYDANNAAVLTKYKQLLKQKERG